MALQKEVWIAGIKENPIPKQSFLYASTDKSEYVDNNKLHLAEAGIEPGVHEDYFSGNEDELPLATIEDIPNEVLLKTYSTERTRHRKLQDVELAYDKRTSVLNRHKISLAKNLGKRAAFAWAPAANNTHNKIANLGGGDSVIDAIIDLRAFYNKLDLYDGMNICFTADHMARLRKEDYKLYKEVINEKTLYGFNVFEYNSSAIYTSAGVKKPWGSTKDATDKQCTFTWVTDEVFRCFGDVEMFATLSSAATQADEVSFAQRALVGNIRANSPKYLGAIL